MNVCGSEKDDVQTKFSPTVPQFFKIILEETLKNNKLQIPNKFWRLYGDTLSGKVCLELPCGLRWEVRLTKSNGKVWMDKGWTDFSKYYSLGRGHLLVFRYEGNSKFHVLIFDKSTTEIDYPSNPNRFEKHGDTDRKPHEFCVEEEIEDDDSVVEVPETFSPHPKTREKSPIPCPRPHKRARTNRPVDKTQSNQSYQRPEADNINFPTKGGGGEKSVPPRRKKCGDTRKKILTAKENAKALRRASGFKSKDPFFKVVMQPSYVGAECTSLWLPSFFVKKYLKSKHADVILKAPDGRTWSVKYTFGVHEETPEGKFLFGWKAFSMANDLKVGDVCVFVLTKSTDILFEVYIFRENGNSTMLPVHKAATSKVRPKGSLSSKVEAGNTINKKTEMSAPETCRKPLTINKKARALETASGYQSENPFFTVTLGASYTTKRRYLNIPYKFATTHINKIEGKAILKVSDGRYWSVMFKVRDRLNSSPVAEFCHGWTAFVRDNSLEQGDCLTFELTNRNDLSFKVSIVKAHDCLPQGKFRKLQIGREFLWQVNQRPASSSVSRASRAASGFFSTNPYFQVTLQPFHLERHLVNLPTAFSKNYFEGKAKTAILQVGNISWPVKLLHYPSDYKLSRGWYKFAKDTSLRPGDVCIFELIDRNKVVLKVSIFGQNR